MAKPTLLLYPGAGTGCDHSSLVATEQRVGSSAFVERPRLPVPTRGSQGSRSGSQADGGNPRRPG